MTKIHPQYINLKTLLQDRLFRIPEYQRAYSWEQKHRKDLFNDLKKSFEDDTEHFMATVVGMYRDEKKTNSGDYYQIVEIVDGQQRITTLILLLKALSEALRRSNDPNEENNAEKLDEILLLKRNDSGLLHINHDRSKYFGDYMSTGKHPESNTAKTLADRELLKAMSECENFVNEWRKNDSLVDLYSHLLHKLTFIFHQISDESLVYSVFEVLNSRGLEVSWFDRLKSLLMAAVFEKDEKIDDVQRIWVDIYRVVGLRIGLNTESMRFAATLKLGNPPSKVLGEEDAVNTLLDQSRKVGEVPTSRWILKVTEALNDLNADNRRNAVTQILQARLVAVAVDLHPDLEDKDSEKEKILRHWENITFRIYGIYGKDARTAVGDYVKLAWRIWQEKLSTDEIMSILSKIGERYPCTEEDLNRELGEKDAYGNNATLSAEELRYFFFRYEEHLTREAGSRITKEKWNHIWAVSVVDSIEHIMPQSNGYGYIHYLGNLTILPPGINSSLKNILPWYKQKIEKYRESGLCDVGDVAERISCDDKWTREKVLEREKALLKWAAQEWGD